jgi:hypothetical protein
MVRRYAHYSAEHLAPFADRLCALRVVIDAVNGTNPSHAENSKSLVLHKPLCPFGHIGYRSFRAHR